MTARALMALLSMVVVTTPLRALDAVTLDDYRAAAEVAIARQDYAAARAGYAEAWKRFDGGRSDRPEIAGLANDYGWLEMRLGNARAARELYQRALAIREKEFGKGDPRTAASLGNLAVSCEAMGDYARAERHYSAAMACLRGVEGKYPAEAATLGNNLGALYRMLRRYDEAIREYERALTLQKRLNGETSPDVAMVWNNLTVAYLAADRLESAAECGRCAYATLKQASPRSPFFAPIIGNLGEIEESRQNWDSAAVWYQQALDLHRQVFGDNNPSVANDYLRLGRIADRKGDTRLAAQNWFNGIQALTWWPEASSPSKSLPLAVRLRPLPLTVTLLWRLARAERWRSRPGESVDMNFRSKAPLLAAQVSALTALKVLGELREGLSPESRSRHEEDFRDLPGFLLMLEKRLESFGDKADPEALLAAMEMAGARAFLDLVAEKRLELGAALPEELRREEEALLAARTSLDLSPADDRFASRYEAVLIAFDSFLARLRAAQPLYAAVRYPASPKLGEIRAALRPDELAVEYSLSAYGAFALALTRDTFLFVELAPAAEIESAVAAARQTVFRGEAGDSEWRRLHQLLWSPVARLAEGRRLVIVPQGAVEGVAFAAFVDDRGGRLGDSREIVHYPSLALMTIMRREKTQRSAAPKLLALGDPLYRLDAADPADLTARNYSRGEQQGWTPLPGTAAEVKLVSACFPAPDSVILLGAAANEKEVRSRDWRDYGYLHFACHGALEDGPGRQPALVLALKGNQLPDDGFLTLDQIAARTTQARLVALSACQTGLASPLLPRCGVSSLARAFLLAGADAVLVSLWSVDDLATARLMAEFYRRHRREGSSPAAALMQAEAALRARAGCDKPLAWAPFILIGE